jgi:TatD DNase family protein
LVKATKVCCNWRNWVRFYWDKTFATQQQEAFEQQMQWALDYRLPIVIHTREAMQATIDAVKPFAKKGLKGIFHCFSGSYESAKEIIGMDFYWVLVEL